MDFAQGWDANDSALLAAALGSIYADVQTTKDSIGRGAEETNPLLGRKPSGATLDKAALVAGGVGAGAALLLPPKWRRPALGAWAGLEAGLAYRNDRTNPHSERKDFMHSGLEGPLMMAALGYFAGELLSDTDRNFHLAFSGVEKGRGMTLGMGMNF